VGQDDGSDLPEHIRGILIGAWMESRMEFDRSVLTISATALGFLLTLLQFTEEPSSAQIAFGAFAFFCFTVAILTIVHIFQRNPSHIERVLENSEGNEHDEDLAFLDGLASFSFYVGVVAIGLLAATTLFEPIFEHANHAPKNERLREETPPPETTALSLGREEEPEHGRLHRSTEDRPDSSQTTGGR
jgi:hypothetical protein